MNQSPISALALISIQHELVMSLAGDLALKPLIQRFMGICLRRLPLCSAHLYLDNTVPYIAAPDTLEDRRIAVPRVHRLPEALHSAVLERLQQQSHSQLPVTLIDVPEFGPCFHLFYISGVGHFVLEQSNEDFPPELLRMLHSALERLRSASVAAIEHAQVVEEVARRWAAENRVEYLAYHDELTGLPNRTRLAEELYSAMEHCRDAGVFGALLYIDVDRFRDINDSLGHSIGDRILQTVAERLNYYPRIDCTVARVGSDEFALLAGKLGRSLDQARTTMLEEVTLLQQRLSEPVVIEGKTLYVEVSVGIVPFPAENQVADDILRHGNVAMYHAKSLGRGSLYCYERGMGEDVERRLSLDMEMRRALINDQFELYFQPQIDGGGHLVAAEALIRWRHPERGMIPPVEFIPVAEKSGLIEPIGDWVLERACRCIADLCEYAGFDVSIAVNISARQLHQVDFLDRVRNTLEKFGAGSNCLVLELTEGTLLDIDEINICKMQALQQMGVHLSLDDFGTGYSSLGYLKRLPLDKLKLDRSFIRDIHNNADDRAIVEATMAIAKRFQLDVVAEGVEFVEARDYLLSIGCEIFQGFLYFRPLPMEEFKQLLKKLPHRKNV